MMTLEEFKSWDELKTKMLRYIMYKKRTEREVRMKFSDIEPDVLDEIIEEFKENRIY